MKEIILTEADQGRTISAEIGDVLILAVQENPTAGYRWSLEEKSDGAHFQISTDFSLLEKAGIGVGGRRTFRMEAIAPGRIQLHLKYWRAFEGESSIQRRLEMTLEIR